MSERQIREYARHDPGEQYWDSCYCGLSKALSAEPDVVVLLRWLEGQEKRLPMNTPVDASLDGAFKVMRHHIEQQFHVRLTADGWKWVEDGE